MTIINSVFKYAVPIENVFVIDMPFGAKLLHFGNNHEEKPCLWALVRIIDGKPAKSWPRKFRLAETGHEMIIQEAKNTLQYVGTALFRDRSFVLHLFEVT